MNLLKAIAKVLDAFDYGLVTLKDFEILRKYDHFNRDAFKPATEATKPKKNEFLVRFPKDEAVSQSGKQTRLRYLVGDKWVDKGKAKQSLLPDDIDVDQVDSLEDWVKNYDIKALDKVQPLSGKNLKLAQDWLEKNADKQGNYYVMYHGDKEGRHEKSKNIKFKHLTSATPKKRIARNFGAPMSDFTGKPVGPGNIHAFLVDARSVFHIPSMWADYSPILKQFSKEFEVIVRPGTYRTAQTTATAAYGDWKGKGWVHYSSVPYLKINPKPFHQDPSGIYLFPKDFKTVGNWKKYPYHFEVEVPADLKVLDMSKMSETEAEDLVRKLTGKEPNIKVSEYSSYQDQAWEHLTMHYGRANPHKFNKDLRTAGYDAVFDDTGSVHTAEIQLIVLDPTKVKVVKLDEPSDSGYDDVVFVMDRLVSLAKDYKVTTEAPVKKKGLWDEEKKVRGRVMIKEGEKEATFSVSPEKTGSRKDQKRPDEIYTYLEWSNTKLNFGAGIRFDRTKRDLTAFDKEFNFILKRMFHPEVELS